LNETALRALLAGAGLALDEQGRAGGDEERAAFLRALRALRAWP
jgi:hypothetical protein